MISNLLSYITRREGRKFLKPSERFDDSAINASTLTSGQPVALYVHIPFCRTLCPFCCFNRYLFKEDNPERNLLLVWSLVILFATLAQRRFNVALALVQIAKQTDELCERHSLGGATSESGGTAEPAARRFHAGTLLQCVDVAGNVDQGGSEVSVGC